MSHRVMTATDTTAAQLLAATVNPTIWLPLTGPAEFSVDVTSAPIRFDLTDATTTPVSVVAATELTDCSTTSHRPEDPIPVNAAVHGVVNRTEVTGLRSQRANVARTKAGLGKAARTRTAEPVAIAAVPVPSSDVKSIIVEEIGKALGK